MALQIDPTSLEKMKKDLDKVINRQDKAYIKAMLDTTDAQMKLKNLKNSSLNSATKEASSNCSLWASGYKFVAILDIERRHQHIFKVRRQAPA